MSDHSREMDQTLPVEGAAVGRGLATGSEGERRASLIVYHRDGVQFVPLEPGCNLVIGRDPEADVCIRDRSLSRRHARVELAGDDVWIEDLGSTNGTWVGGERLQRAPLKPGDVVTLGAVTAALHRLAPLESADYGLDSHDRLVDLLEGEIARARAFQRKLALLVVRSVGSGANHVGAWSPAIRQRLRAYDRMALYSPTTVDILLPEVSADDALQLGRAVTEPNRGSASRLLCGVGVFPDTATSGEALLESALQASQEAYVDEPVRVAPSHADREWAPAGSAGGHGDGPVVQSAAMRRVYGQIAKLSNAALPVLLVGETGSGKELVARALHEGGRRRDRTMRSVNCGAIPENLVESTLFGHERGAFTGASQQAKGVFEVADGGTVFLDEIGELPPSAQAALLRVLETQRFTRVGSHKEIQVDVRVVAATHRDLEEMCRTGAFRVDLLYRLNAVTVNIPPLRDRSEEIEPLVAYFMRLANDANGCQVQRMEPDAISLLRRYPWPGNVRELRNAVERAVVIAQDDVITVDDLPERVRELRGSVRDGAGPVRTTDPGDLRSRMQEYEAEIIVDALRRSGGSRTEAAQLLGLPVRTLAHKMKSLGIRRAGPEYEADGEPDPSD